MRVNTSGRRRRWSLAAAAVAVVLTVTSGVTAAVNAAALARGRFEADLVSLDVGWVPAIFYLFFLSFGVAWVDAQRLGTWIRACLMSAPFAMAGFACSLWWGYAQMDELERAGARIPSTAGLAPFFLMIAAYLCSGVATPILYRLLLRNPGASRL